MGLLPAFSPAAAGSRVKLSTLATARPPASVRNDPALKLTWTSPALKTSMLLLRFWSLKKYRNVLAPTMSG